MELQTCTNCLNDILDNNYTELESSIDGHYDIVCDECICSEEFVELLQSKD